jgi:hypothetical protein
MRILGAYSVVAASTLGQRRQSIAAAAADASSIRWFQQKLQQRVSLPAAHRTIQF